MQNLNPKVDECGNMLKYTVMKIYSPLITDKLDKHWKYDHDNT